MVFYLFLFYIYFAAAIAMTLYLLSLLCNSRSSRCSRHEQLTGDCVQLALTVASDPTTPKDTIKIKCALV